MHSMLWYLAVIVAPLLVIGWLLYLDWPRKPQEKPAIRISQEWLQANRDEIVFNAIKQGPTGISND